MALEELTTADIIRAGSVSEKAAVRKAFEKLEFSLLISHTEEEIEDLCDHAVHHVRISQKTKDGLDYDAFVIRWADDQFVIYSPSDGTPIAGNANTLDKDPTLIYFNKPATEEKININKIEAGLRRAINKTKAKRK